MEPKQRSDLFLQQVEYFGNQGQKEYLIATLLYRLKLRFQHTSGQGLLFQWKPLSSLSPLIDWRKRSDVPNPKDYVGGPCSNIFLRNQFLQSQEVCLLTRRRHQYPFVQKR